MFRILVDSDEERLHACASNALSRLGQVISFLHEMHHEATACHVMPDLIQAMRILASLLAALNRHLHGLVEGQNASTDASSSSSSSSPAPAGGASRSAIAALIRTYIQQWKDVPDVMRKLLSLLNSYASHECRAAVLDIFSQLLAIHPRETALFLANNLAHHHANFHHALGQMSTQQITQQLGPFYPRRASSSSSSPPFSPSPSAPPHPLSAFPGFGGSGGGRGGGGGGSGGGVAIRPPKAQFQLFVVPPSRLFSSDDPHMVEAYREALAHYFDPYHRLVDRIHRVALETHSPHEDVIRLGAYVGLEALRLGTPYFCRFWLDVVRSAGGASERMAATRETALSTLIAAPAFGPFFQTLFEEERHAFNQQPVFEFVHAFVERAPNRCLRRDTTPLLNVIAVSVEASLHAMVTAPNLEKLFVIAKKINGDLRALLILFSTYVFPAGPSYGASLSAGLDPFCHQDFFRCVFASL